ncbi:MAG TPA: hypothetical protein VLH35_09055 [Candidatus Acidoferrales bacterium]|nr:hypothetical protein [Candidatus Acidoferrales bacterium]
MQALEGRFRKQFSFRQIGCSVALPRPASPYKKGKFSILEVAVDPSYFNNNQQALQAIAFYILRLRRVAAGCILILQAVQVIGYSVMAGITTVSVVSKNPFFVFIGMWRFLILHMSAFVPSSVWRSGCFPASVSTCRCPFSPQIISKTPHTPAISSGAYCSAENPLSPKTAGRISQETLTKSH